MLHKVRTYWHKVWKYVKKLVEWVRRNTYKLYRSIRNCKVCCTIKNWIWSPLPPAPSSPPTTINDETHYCSIVKSSNYDQDDTTTIYSNAEEREVEEKLVDNSHYNQEVTTDYLTEEERAVKEKLIVKMESINNYEKKELEDNYKEWKRKIAAAPRDNNNDVIESEELVKFSLFVEKLLTRYMCELDNLKVRNFPDLRAERKQLLKWACKIEDVLQNIPFMEKYLRDDDD